MYKEKRRNNICIRKSCKKIIVSPEKIYKNNINDSKPVKISQTEISIDLMCIYSKKNRLFL